MIIVRTPYRISFFGGGSDYPSWYSRHGGCVLTTTIDKYCYISLRQMPAFLGSKYRIFWSHMETVETVDEIKHAGVRGCLQFLNIEEGIEVNHAGDLPARSGLGSSSAFTVGMLHALHVMHGVNPSKRTLADEAIKVEQDVLCETVGVQDQIQCSYGGFNHISIHKDGAYNVSSLHLSPEFSERLSSHLLLVFTGIQRHASEIAADQVANADKREKELHSIVDLVPEALDALAHEDIQRFGELLHESWMLKRQLSDNVSNNKIDELYATAKQHGAIGGKIIGAGGGGFMLLLAPPERHDRLRHELGLLTTPVQFEEHGTQLILS